MNSVHIGEVDYIAEMDSDTDTDFDDRAASFPCMFSKDPLQASTSRMKEIKVKLQDELDVDDDCYEEVIAKLNFYTWIEFKLSHFEKAVEHNERALKLSSRKNITSLVNHAYIARRDGDDSGAEDSLDKAEELIKGSDEDRLMTDVEAELAYSYSRLNGPDNLTRAIEIYARVVERQPEIYAWKYRFGLAHRRATHGNMYTAMPSGYSHTEHTKRAAEQLFEVARESPDSSLRSRAYSQLAVMCNYSNFLNESEYRDIFEANDLSSLIEEALKYGPNDARTLAECGRILRHSDLERATDLLEKSLKIKKHSITLHHLGLCYDMKARNRARSECQEKQHRGRSQGDFSSQRDEILETDSVAHQSSFLDDGRSSRDGPMRNYSRGSKKNDDKMDIVYSTGQRGKYSQQSMGCSSGGSKSHSNGWKRWISQQESGAWKNSGDFHSSGHNYESGERFHGNHSSNSRPLYNSQDIRNKGSVYTSKQNACSHQYSSRGAKRYSETYPEQDKGFTQQCTGRYNPSREQNVSFVQDSGRQQVYSKQDSRYQDKNRGRHNSYSGQDNRHKQEGQQPWYNQQDCSYPWKGFERQHSYTEQDSRYGFKNQPPRQNSRGRQSNPGFHRGLPGRAQSNRKSFPFIRCPVQVLPLSRDDPLVVQAIDCYTQAVDLSYDNNNPARYNLGLILRSCGDMQGAIKQFNKIIRLTSGSGIKRGKSKENPEYLITVTCAYEQAGLCLLDLAKQDGTAKEKAEKNTKDGEKKLMQAVGLAATLSNSDPEMKNHYKLVWNAFRTLETKFEGADDSPEIIKKYIELLKLTSRFEKIPGVIDKLRRLGEDELADPKVLKSGLESYLALKQYEDAFTFLSVSLTNHLDMDCLRKQLHLLTLKVRLLTAASRLQTQEGSAKLILKPLFDKENIGPENERGYERAEDDVELQKQKDVKDDEVLDVLIFYDAENEETIEDLTEKVDMLQRTISCDFGLDVNNIAARRLPGRLKLDRRVEEISRARTVLVLLSEDTQSSIFRDVLAYIPSIITDCRENGRPEPNVLLGLSDGTVNVPRMLKSFYTIDMSTVLDRIQISPEEEEEEELVELMESKVSQTDVKILGKCRDNTRGSDERASGKDYHLRPGGAREGSLSQSSVEDFSDCVGAKMSLFCALINKEWTNFVKSP